MRMRVWALVLSLLAAAVLSFGRKEETLEQLIARANEARPDQQADLYMEVADRELKFAVEANKAGQSEALRSALQQIVKYSGNAHAIAVHADKRLKRTEIRLRAISSKLRDLKSNAEVDDQAPVQSAIDRVEDFRTDLLRAMFGSKHNE
jgi:hypothetical protein